MSRIYEFMRKWEAVLRRDTVAWDDFKNWLDGMRANALNALMAADNMDRARGVVEGITSVAVAATANEREETARGRI